MKTLDAPSPRTARPALCALTALMALSALLTACGTAPVPVPRNFEATDQFKAGSAAHWQAMARHVVKQSVAGVQSLVQMGPLYVAAPAEPSEFERAFAELLTTELVRAGFDVRHKPSGAVIVSYRAQVVHHRAPRPALSATYPLQWTSLTAGLMVLGGLATESTSGAKAALLATAGLADAAISADAGGTTGTELLLSTTFTLQSAMVARVSEVYYLDTVDRGLYVFHRPPPPPPSREFKVVP